MPTENHASPARDREKGLNSDAMISSARPWTYEGLRSLSDGITAAIVSDERLKLKGKPISERVVACRFAFTAPSFVAARHTRVRGFSSIRSFHSIGGTFWGGAGKDLRKVRAWTCGRVGGKVWDIKS